MVSLNPTSGSTYQKSADFCLLWLLFYPKRARKSPKFPQTNLFKASQIRLFQQFNNLWKLLFQTGTYLFNWPNADIFAKGPNARLPSVFVIDRGLGRRREEDIRQFRNPGEGIVCTVVEWTVMDEGETSRMLSPYSSLLLVLQQ